MLCKINGKYQRNILIKLLKPFSPLFSLKIVIKSEIQFSITLGTHVVDVQFFH